MKKICKGCGKKFEIANSQSKRYVYCSLKCRSKYQRGKKHPNFGKKFPNSYKNLGKYSNPWSKKDEEYVIKNHLKIPIKILSKKIGKKEFTVRKWMNKRNIKGIKPPSWNKGKKRPEMSGKNHPLFGKHHTEKTKRKISGDKVRALKISKSLKGKPKSEKHRISLSISKQEIKKEDWKGFIGLEPYDEKFNRNFEKEIRKRDNQICMLCGIHREKLKKALFIHHIDYDKKNTTKENCLSLCGSCHPKTNGNRKHWTIFFQSLLSEKYRYKYEVNKNI